MPHSSKKNNHTDSIPPFLQNPTPSYDPPPLQQFFHPPFPGIFGKVNLPFKKRGVGGRWVQTMLPPKPQLRFTHLQYVERPSAFLFQSLPFYYKYALWPWSGNMNMDSSPYRMLLFFIYHRKSRTKKHLLF